MERCARVGGTGAGRWRAAGLGRGPRKQGVGCPRGKEARMLMLRHEGESSPEQGTAPG